jgi:hypothetical protein
MPLILLAAIFAVFICGQTEVLAQNRVGRTGTGAAGEVGAQGTASPVVTVQPPVSLQTTINPSLLVVPPQGAKAEPAPEGGDSGCTCPDGQQRDIEGWCWRPTDAASGYWAKAEKCQS